MLFALDSGLIFHFVFHLAVSEFKLTRTDQNDTGLLVTSGNCLGGGTFRAKITGFGNFQTGIWGTDSVAGTCLVTYGGVASTTNGFGQRSCTGNIGAPNSVSFFSDWSQGDGAVMMILCKCTLH